MDLECQKIDYTLYLDGKDIVSWRAITRSRQQNSDKRDGEICVAFSRAINAPRKTIPRTKANPTCCCLLQAFGHFARRRWHPDFLRANHDKRKGVTINVALRNQRPNEFRQAQRRHGKSRHNDATLTSFRHHSWERAEKSDCNKM